VQRVRELRHAYAIKRAFARNALRFQDFGWAMDRYSDLQIAVCGWNREQSPADFQLPHSACAPEPSRCRANAKLEKIAPLVQVHFISSQHVGA